MIIAVMENAKKLPESCADCNLNYDWQVCSADTYYYAGKEKEMTAARRPDWCPLVEVPQVPNCKNCGLYKAVEKAFKTYVDMFADMVVRLKATPSKCIDCEGGYCEEDCGVPYVSPCVGCNGRICEICTEGKDDD